MVSPSLSVFARSTASGPPSGTASKSSRVWRHSSYRNTESIEFILAPRGAASRWQIRMAARRTRRDARGPCRPRGRRSRCHGKAEAGAAPPWAEVAPRDRVLERADPAGRAVSASAVSTCPGAVARSLGRACRPCAQDPRSHSCLRRRASPVTTRTRSPTDSDRSSSSPTGPVARTSSWYALDEAGTDTDVLRSGTTRSAAGNGPQGTSHHRGTGASVPPRHRPGRLGRPDPRVSGNSTTSDSPTRSTFTHSASIRPGRLCGGRPPSPWSRFRWRRTSSVSPPTVRTVRSTHGRTGATVRTTTFTHSAYGAAASWPGPRTASPCAPRPAIRGTSWCWRTA